MSDEDSVPCFGDDGHVLPLDDILAAAIGTALRNDGHIARVAGQLGMSRTSLYRWFERYPAIRGR